MRRTFITIAVLVAGLIAWVGAQQEMQPRPGPGSGITRSAQHGDWEVAISNVPTVRVATITAGVPLRAPQFIRNRTYKVTWPNGDEERVTVITVPDVRATDRNAERDRLPERSPESSTDGWVEVSSSGARRWINILAARAIQEAQ